MQYASRRPAPDAIEGGGRTYPHPQSAGRADLGDNRGAIERRFCFYEVTLRYSALLWEFELNYSAKAVTLL
jgi:hypothetical protein